MEAAFFGPAGEELYGVYYPPAGSRPPGRGVVICPPLFREFVFSVKALHHCAAKLAAAGVAAFRFHYYGTGDSAGNLADASVSRWLADIGDATQELRNRGCRQIGIAGLGFGGTMAALYAGRNREVDSLTLWEPCVDGADALREFRRGDARVFAEALFECPERREEMHGQAFPDRLRDEIGAIRLGDCFDSRVRVLLVEHREEHSASLRPQLEESCCPADYVTADAPRFWESTLGLSHIPRELLDRITAWTADGCAP